MIVTPIFDDVWAESGVVASTGVTYSQRQRRMNVGVTCVVRVPSVIAEALKNVGNTLGGIGSGSTVMKV